jgi:hypothetical protein
MLLAELSSLSTSGLHCPSNSAHAADGRLVLSIDRHTFLVLKSELYDVYDKSLPYITNAITRINYDVSIPDSAFVFKPPVIQSVPPPFPFQGVRTSHNFGTSFHSPSLSPPVFRMASNRRHRKSVLDQSSCDD